MARGMTNMASYVLVHGAGWGGIVWTQVALIMRAAGHEVFTPTLTGLGERTHLASPDIDLETHIADLVGVLEYHDLRKVIVAGHSYGGMVIAGAADRCCDRLAHLVYLDAHAPRDGESVFDLVGRSAAEETRELARTQGGGWSIPVPPDAVFRRFMRPHPLKTCAQRISLKNAALTDKLPHTYVYCTNPALPWIAKSAERARTERWSFRELPTDHMAMLTMPVELSEILLQLSESER